MSERDNRIVFWKNHKRKGKQPYYVGFIYTEEFRYRISLWPWFGKRGMFLKGYVDRMLKREGRIQVYKIRSKERPKLEYMGKLNIRSMKYTIAMWNIDTGTKQFKAGKITIVDPSMKRIDAAELRVFSPDKPLKEIKYKSRQLRPPPENLNF